MRQVHKAIAAIIISQLAVAVAAQDCRAPVNSSCATYGMSTGPSAQTLLKPSCCLPAAAASGSRLCVPIVPMTDTEGCTFDTWGSYSEPQCCNQTTVTGTSLLPPTVSARAAASPSKPDLAGTQLVIPTGLWVLLAQQQILLEYAQTQRTGFSNFSLWQLGEHPCWYHGTRCSCGNSSQQFNSNCLTLEPTWRSYDIRIVNHQGALPVDFGSLNITRLAIGGQGPADSAYNWTWGIAGEPYGQAAPPPQPATGQLPSAWGRFPALQALLLSDMPGITGTLPAAWGNFSTTLQAFWLSNLPGITGTLPRQWGAWSHLRWFGMEHMPGLTGGLPDDWQTLGGDPSLTSRGCDNASTYGASLVLPRSEGQECAFPRIHLISLGLNGSLSPAWSRMPLGHLTIANTPLTGSLPSSWGNLTALNTLVITNTSISGPLPGSWSGMTNLTRLDLSRNLISGSLPASWSQLIGYAGNKYPDAHDHGRGCQPYLGCNKLASLNLMHNLLRSHMPGEWCQAYKASFQSTMTLLTQHSNFSAVRRDQISYASSASDDWLGDLRLIQPSSAMPADHMKQRQQANVNIGTSESCLASLCLSPAARHDLFHDFTSFRTFISGDDGTVGLNAPGDFCFHVDPKLLLVALWTTFGAVLVGSSGMLVIWTSILAAPAQVSLKASGPGVRKKLPLHLAQLAWSGFDVALHCYDIVTDIIVISSTFGNSAGWGGLLLGILLCQYAVAGLLILLPGLKKILDQPASRGTCMLHCLGFILCLPLLVTILEVCMLLDLLRDHDQLPACIPFHDLLPAPLAYYRSRNLWEALLNSAPQAALQSFLYAKGNTPNQKLYLSLKEFLTSSVGSLSSIIFRLDSTIVFAWLSSQGWFVYVTRTAFCMNAGINSEAYLRALKALVCGALQKCSRCCCCCHAAVTPGGVASYVKKTEDLPNDI